MSPACASSIELPVSCTWRGSRAGLRVDPADDPRDVLGVGPGRAHHDLAPQQPLAPLNVDDHPGGQLAGQQPGAALQGDALAEGGVLEEQPGGGGDQVEPVGDGLDGADGLAAVRGRGDGVAGRDRGRDGRGRGGLGGGLAPARRGRWCRRRRRRRLGRGGTAGNRDGRGHHQAGLGAAVDDVEQQHGADHRVPAEQRAGHPAALAGAHHRGQLGVHRGPGRQVHERGQRLAGGVPGARAEQLPGADVGPADGAVPVQQEHRHRRAGEHGPQQAALGVGGVRALVAGRDGLGPQPRGRVDRPVQLGERGLEQLRQRGAGQGGGLPQRAGTRAERGNLALRPRSAAQVLHMKSGSLSKGGPRPPGLRGQVARRRTQFRSGRPVLAHRRWSRPQMRGRRRCRPRIAAAGVRSKCAPGCLRGLVAGHNRGRNGAYDAGTPPRRHGVVAEQPARMPNRFSGGPFVRLPEASPQSAPAAVAFSQEAAL